MRKIKEILRLKFEANLSHQRIAAATGVSKGAVTNTVTRAMAAGVSWPLPAEVDESRLDPSETFASGRVGALDNRFLRANEL